MRIAMRHLSCGRAVNVLCHGIHSILQTLITTQYLNYKYLRCDCLIAMAHPRTHIVDVATTNHDWEDKALYELAECAISSTQAAVNNTNPLPNFDEYDQL